MNKIDKLYDMLETEMAIQMLYNKYMLQVTNAEVRQLLMQMRDAHMQHVTQLQQQIQQWMKNPTNLN